MKTNDWMTVEEAIANLDARFTSGNEIPVSQSRITAKEYEALRDIIMFRREVDAVKAAAQQEAAEEAGRGR